MRCNNCPALKYEYDGCEYPEYYCAVGYKEESRDFADGSEGCLHRLSTIEKRLKHCGADMCRKADQNEEWGAFIE